MIDLTGANLISYVLRQVRDIVGRHPRFRSALGEVVFSTNNAVLFGDVQVQVKNLTTQGNRQSPDYFVCTQHGQAVLAKMADRDGAFVEWVRENVSTPLAAGVHYLNVDAVDEATREVTLTVHSFRWIEGKSTNAVGSKIVFRPGIDTSKIALYDAGKLDGFGAPAVLHVGTDYRIAAEAIFLYTPVSFTTSPSASGLLVTNATTGVPLVPEQDYWFEREFDYVLGDTTGSWQILYVPSPDYVSISFVDQDGYQLREGIDFSWLDASRIRLGEWTPVGSTITARGIFKVDPTANTAMHPENFIDVGLQPGESLAVGQIFIQTPSGDVTQVTPQPDGSLMLPTLLSPGDWCRYELRVDEGQSVVKARKRELNGNIIPGLVVAIGDSVTVDDQCVIIVSPTVGETYEVYGAKENLSFTLDVKANDPATASEISELLKRDFLIRYRDGMEADGLTIFEMTRDTQAQARDASGTAASYIYSMVVQAAADWEYHVPLVTRLVSLEIDDVPVIPDFPGKLQMAPRLKAVGQFAFVAHYA